MPLTVRIQRACGLLPASGPLLRFGVGLLTEITGEVMMTADTIADRVAGLAAGLARLDPAAGGARAGAAPDAAEQDKAEKRPARILMMTSRNMARDLEMARTAGKIPR